MLKLGFEIRIDGLIVVGVNSAKRLGSSIFNGETVMAAEKQLIQVRQVR
jgi:hypothetical protein